MKLLNRSWVSFLVLVCGASTSALAAAITPGNLVIYRVGTGAAALDTTATAVFLDEYTTNGTRVQSIALPSSGASAFTAVGNSTSEGVISRSQDGGTFIFTGYRKASGGTRPSGDTYAVTPRVVGTLTMAGTVNTATTLTSDGGSTTANAIRSATSVDGTSAFWVLTSARVSYHNSPFAAAGTTLIGSLDGSQLNLSDDELFASGSPPDPSAVLSYGTLPTGVTVPSTVVAMVGLSESFRGFVLSI